MPGAPLSTYLAVAVLLFAIGTLGILLRRSPLLMLMGIELMWNGANLALVSFARFTGNPDGQVLAFVALVVAAAEVAVALALVVLLARRPREGAPE